MNPNFNKLNNAISAFNQVSIDKGDPYASICILSIAQKSTAE